MKGGRDTPHAGLPPLLPRKDFLDEVLATPIATQARWRRAARLSGRRCARGGKVRRGSKSMGHNVDKVCKLEQTQDVAIGVFSA